MANYGLLSSNTGLLNGLAEGLKGGLEAFNSERDRKDKRKLAEEEQLTKRMTLAQHLADQKEQHEIGVGGLLSKGGFRLAPEGTELTKTEQPYSVGNTPLAFDTSYKPELNESIHGKGGGQPKQGVGGQSLDRHFAGTWNKYKYEGGEAAATRGIQEVDDVLGKLQNGEIETGGARSGLPLQAYTNPKVKAAVDQVKQAVSNTLKEVYGGQLSIQEGNQAYAFAMDPQLPTKENIPKLQYLNKYLQQVKDAKDSAGDYFENNNGSMQGYKAPKLPNLTQALKDYKPPGESKQGLLGAGSSKSGLSDSEAAELKELEKKFGNKK